MNLQNVTTFFQGEIMLVLSFERQKIISEVFPWIKTLKANLCFLFQKKMYLVGFCDRSSGAFYLTTTRCFLPNYPRPQLSFGLIKHVLLRLTWSNKWSLWLKSEWSIFKKKYLNLFLDLYHDLCITLCLFIRALNISDCLYPHSIVCYYLLYLNATLYS